MKIEKINEQQIRLVIRDVDLEKRNMSISELTYSSDKTQQLFRDILTELQSEHDFLMEDMSLMFEATRVGVDSLVVLITKVDGLSEYELSNQLIPHARAGCRFKRIEKLIKPKDPGTDSYSIFSFDDLDTLASATTRLNANFKGKSQVYKLDGRYFLLLINETPDLVPTVDMEKVLFEFGKKHVSGDISHKYLNERGKIILAEDAIRKMLEYVGGY